MFGLTLTIGCKTPVQKIGGRKKAAGFSVHEIKYWGSFAGFKGETGERREAIDQG
jgi:hypothetical protein